MKYEILGINDNGTIQVKMTVDDHELVQDFATEEDVKRGLVIFKAELDRRPVIEQPTSASGEEVAVDPKDLPVISEDDFKPEPPAAANIASEQAK